MRVGGDKETAQRGSPLGYAEVFVGTCAFEKVERGWAWWAPGQENRCRSEASLLHIEALSPQKVRRDPTGSWIMFPKLHGLRETSQPGRPAGDSCGHPVSSTGGVGACWWGSP